MSQNYTIKDYAKISAEKEISKYSEEQIAQLAKKEKRIGYISMAVLFAVDIGMIAMFVLSLLEKLSFAAVSSAIVFSVSLVFNIFYYLKNKNNTNYVWAVKYLEKKYINNPNAFPEFPIYEHFVDRNSSSEVTQIDKEINYDKSINEFFYSNKIIFEQKILDIINVATKLSFNRTETINQIRQAYKLFAENKNIYDINDIVKFEIKKTRNKIVNSFYSSDYSSVNKEFLFDRLDEVIAKEYSEYFLIVGSERTAVLETYLSSNYYCKWIKSYLDVEFKISYLKLFTYTNFLVNVILPKVNFSKILNTAYNKFNNDETVKKITYEILIDDKVFIESEVKFDFFSKATDFFCLIDTEKKKHYIFSDIFSVKETDSFKINDFVNFIIENKLYKNYELEFLLNTIIYEKIIKFESIEELFNELDKRNYYKGLIQKEVLKDSLISKEDEEIEIEKGKATIVDIDLMSGTEFEDFLCNYFKDIGYKCERTKTTGDQGVDLIAIKDETRIAIQAKCYSGVVGNHAIMEVFAGAKYYNANKCMVITNSTFTKSAIELAKTNGVILWDRQVLVEKLSQL